MRRSLYESYQAKIQGLRPAQQEILPFSDYVEQMQHSPRDITEAEMIQLFDLENYSHYKRQVEAVAVTQRTADHQVTTLRYSWKLEHALEESELWELGFATYIWAAWIPAIPNRP